MAKCRIQTLTPQCGYNGSGVMAVMLLDLDDFLTFVFDDDEGYQSCYVDAIIHIGEFVTIDFKDFPAQYNGPLASGIYTHSIEAFINELSAEIISNLHLATKRPQLVVFKTWDGRYFTFGQETGAKVNYTAQTTDGTGAAITIAQNSPYPLFEVNPAALGDNPEQPYTYALEWTQALCEIDGATDTFTGNQQATLAVKISSITGEPLDKNNAPTSISGLPQAALLLIGAEQPTGYYIEGYFNRGDLINGEPTLRYAPDICQEGVVVGWILQTGFWDMSAYWLDDGIWNY